AAGSDRASEKSRRCGSPDVRLLWLRVSPRSPTPPLKTLRFAGRPGGSNWRSRVEKKSAETGAARFLAILIISLVYTSGADDRTRCRRFSRPYCAWEWRRGAWLLHLVRQAPRSRCQLDRESETSPARRSAFP